MQDDNDPPTVPAIVTRRDASPGWWNALPLVLLGLIGLMLLHSCLSR